MVSFGLYNATGGLIAVDRERGGGRARLTFNVQGKTYTPPAGGGEVYDGLDGNLPAGKERQVGNMAYDHPA